MKHRRLMNSERNVVRVAAEGARTLVIGAALAATAAVGCAPAEDVLDGRPAPAEAITVAGEAIPGWPPEGAELAAAQRPPAMGAPTGALPPGLAARGANATMPEFVLPPGWETETPASSMRMGQWRGPGNVECALFSFPGGGDVRANVSRWVNQFEQPDGSASAEQARSMSMTIDSVDSTFVRVEGTFLSQSPPMTGEVVRLENYGLFGVVFEVSPDPYFVKCVGPAEAIEAQAEPLTAFIGSFRFGG